MPIGGLGGKANDIRAGGAVWEISAKDSLTTALTRTQAKTSAWAKQMGDHSKKVSEGFGASRLGALGLFGGAAAGAKLFLDMASGAEKFNAEMEKTAKLSAQIAVSQDNIRKSVFARVGGKLSPEVDALPFGDRAGFLETTLAQAQRDLTGIGQAADKSRDQLTELQGGWNLLIQRIPVWSDALEQSRTMTRQQTDALNEQRQAQKQYVKELTDQIRAIKEAPAREAFKNIQSLNEELRTQLEITRRGLTADQEKVFRLERGLEKQGINPDTAETRNLMNQIGLAKQFKDTKTELVSMTRDFEDSLKNAGKSAEQLRLEKLIEQDRFGLDMQNAIGLVGMMDDLRRMEEGRKQVNEVPKQMQQLTQSLRGAFGGGNLAQSLGIGTGTVHQRQLDELKKVGIEAKQIKTGIHDLPREIGDEIDRNMRLR